MQDFSVNLSAIRGVILIGVGGTGGYIARDIIRLLAQESNFYGDIIIIDPDKVEMKNINRQNFTIEDVGQYKASVIANRYGSKYGINISTVLEYMDKDKLVNILNELDRKRLYGSNYIVIDSVDTKKARYGIHSALNYKAAYSDNTYWWISAGNEKRDGQVIISKHIYSDITQSIVDLFPHEFTPTALEKEAEELNRISCAQNNLEDPQSIAANLSSAHNAILMFYNLVFDKLTYNYVDFNINNTSKAFVQEIKQVSEANNILFSKLVNELSAKNQEILEDAFLKSA